MKLDSRIYKDRKPLDCFDAEKAEKFVGQKGYASDDISTFTDLDFCESGKLEYVVKENGNGICYPYSVVTDYNRKEYAFFLPAAWVKNTEEQQQFIDDVWKLSTLIHEFVDCYNTHTFEITKRHYHEREKFLEDVFKRVLADPWKEY